MTVEFTTVRGQVVSFVARLMLHLERKDLCVIRYDTAHGKPHLDRVNFRGKLVEKKWLLGMSFADALSYAIEDIRLNHETYISHFKRQSPDPS